MNDKNQNLEAKATDCAELDLSGRDVGDDVCQAIRSACPNVLDLRELCLSRIKLGDEGANLIAEWLASVPTHKLTHLDLSYNGLRSGAHKVAKVYFEASEVERLEEDKLTILSGERSLNLSNNPLKDDGVTELTWLLCSARYGAILRIRNTQCTTHCMQAFSRCKHAIVELDVGDNAIDAVGVKQLAHAMHDAPHWRTLIINELSKMENGKDCDACRIALSKSLETTKLKKLNFGGNGLQDGSAAQLIDSLFQKGKHCLEAIAFGASSIAMMCCTSIKNVLHQNVVLREIDLPNNKIDDESAKALSEGLAENVYITRLMLANNRIGHRGAFFISQGLKRQVSQGLKFGDNESCCLVELDMSFNPIEDVGLVHILGAVVVALTYVKDAMSFKKPWGIEKLHLNGAADSMKLTKEGFAHVGRCADARAGLLHGAVDLLQKSPDGSMARRLLAQQIRRPAACEMIGFALPEQVQARIKEGQDRLKDLWPQEKKEVVAGDDGDQVEGAQEPAGSDGQSEGDVAKPCATSADAEEGAQTDAPAPGKGKKGAPPAKGKAAKGGPPPPPSKGKGPAKGGPPPPPSKGKGGAKGGPPPPPAKGKGGGKGPGKPGKGKGQPKAGVAADLKHFGEPAFGKRWHWSGSQFADAVEGSLFFEVTKTDGEVDVDTSLWKAVFLDTAKASAPKAKEVKVRGKRTGTELVDQKRAQAIMIAYKKILPMSIEDLCKMLSSLDMADVKLSDENLEFVGTVLPTEDERTTLLKHEAEVKELRYEPEQIVFPLCRIPRIHIRLRLVKAGLEHNDNFQMVMHRCNTMELAALQIMSSKAWRVAINLVTKVLNFANHGTTDERIVKGFDINSLEQLETTKQGNMTAMSALMINIRKQHPTFLEDLKSELSHVKEAARENSLILAGDVAKVQQEAKFVAEQRKNFENHNANDSAIPFLTKLSAKMANQAQEVADQHRESVDSVQKLAAFLASDGQRPKKEAHMEDVVKPIVFFLENFAQSWVEFERRPSKQQRLKCLYGLEIGEAEKVGRTKEMLTTLRRKSSLDADQLSRVELDSVLFREEPTAGGRMPLEQCRRPVARFSCGARIETTTHEADTSSSRSSPTEGAAPGSSKSPPSNLQGSLWRRVDTGGASSSSSCAYSGDHAEEATAASERWAAGVDHHSQPLAPPPKATASPDPLSPPALPRLKAWRDVHEEEEEEASTVTPPPPRPGRKSLQALPSPFRNRPSRRQQPTHNRIHGDDSGSGSDSGAAGEDDVYVHDWSAHEFPVPDQFHMEGSGAEDGASATGEEDDETDEDVYGHEWSTHEAPPPDHVSEEALRNPSARRGD